MLLQQKWRLKKMTKGRIIASWIIQVLVAGLFLMMGSQKLMSDPELVANFARWGLPDKMYLVIGFFEVLGAVGLLIPRFAGLAASGLILIMIGALFTHLTHGEILMAMMPLMVMILLGVVVFLRNPLNAFGKSAEGIG